MTTEFRLQDISNIQATTPPRRDIQRRTKRMLKLLAPGKLKIAAFPNFYPICYDTSQNMGDRHPSPAGTISEAELDEKNPDSTQGHFAGLEVELLLRFCKEYGLDPEIIAVQDFDNLWTYPVKRKADVCIGGITVAPNRTHPGLAWSEAYYKVSRTVIYHRRRPPRPGMGFPQAMEGVVRGVPGSTGFKDAKRRLCALGKQHQLEESVDDAADIRALLRGDIQGLMRGSAVGRAIVQQHPKELAIMESWEILPELRPTPQGEVFCFPVHENSGLAETLTKFLARERATGSLQSLLRKYALV